METRFSHLYQRDSSVSMLRVKMARRRSQSQKENRDRAVNRHRHLDQLPELETSALDESAIKSSMAASEGMRPGQKEVKSGRSSAVEERKKMLARYKEAKELQKEKEKRQKEKKGGVFKVGLYKPQPVNALPQISSAPTRAKTAVPAPSSRVTRSMKQQIQKPVTAAASRKVQAAVVRTPAGRAVGKPQSTATPFRGKAAPVEAAVRATTTRAGSRSQTASLAGARNPASGVTVNVSTTRATNKEPAAPPIGRGKPAQGKGATRIQSRVLKSEKAAEVEEMDTSSADPHPEVEQARMEEREVEEGEREVEEGEREVEEGERKMEEERETPPAGFSFAPQGFVFQAPSSLQSFQSVPLTPRSADAFLTPSYSGIPPVLSFSPMAPRGHVEPHRPSPSPSPRGPMALSGPQEPPHDVLYFRSVLTSETDRLSALCGEWEPRAEDSSIPEESRDRMRTAIGQARLLVKERFHQFLGLVDDCDLGRGEKVTTCTDLQGFWDMVYFQVEDVIRKFDALREAESRGWQEEHKPPPRLKKAKKPAPAPAAGKRVAGVEANAAARSRLAAVKAAMKAKRAAEAEKPAPGPSEAQPDPDPVPAAQTVVFNGGFFRVESPVRVPGALRGSSRRSAVPSLHGSPCPGSQFTTLARRRPSASACPSPLPQLSLSTPSACTPRPLPQAQSSPPKPMLRAGAPCGQSEYDAGQSPAPRVPQEPVAASADDQTQQTGTCSQPPEAPSSQSQTLEGWAEPNGLSKLVPEGEGHTASQLEGVAEPKTDSCVLPVPCARSPSGQALMADTEGQNSSASLSPCQKADLHPTEGHGLSFTLSPCPSNGGEQRSPPALSPSLLAPLGSHTPAPCSTDSPAGSSEACMAVTPDTSYVENTPGLDFERYLQPTLRCSPSPQVDVVAMEAASPLTTPTCTDVQMDSPGSQRDGLPEGDSVAHSGPVSAQTPVQLAALEHTFTPQTDKLEDGALLLFTPEPRDRVRQSVCERDLIVFTPPCSH